MQDIKKTTENEDIVATFGLWNKTYSIPAKIIDNYLPLASGTFIKVILYIFKNLGEKLSISKMSQELKIPQSEVVDAIYYWQKENILPNFSHDEFDAKQTEPQNEQMTITIKESVLQEVKFPPRPKPSEILKLKEENKEIKEFLSQCEKILDKMLTVTEITDLVWYNQGLGLSFDIVLMLIDYCKRVNKTSLAYISKVAINWWENEINTHQKARFNIIYLENLNARQSVIKKAFGIYNRKLSKKEAEYIQTWYDVFKYDITIIEKAYETCVDTTGKVSFPYINKTLTVWFNSNLKTVEEIEQFNIEHKQEQQKQYSENSIKKAKKSQLGAKFEQSSIDYDELQNFLNKNI